MSDFKCTNLISFPLDFLPCHPMLCESQCLKPQKQIYFSRIQRCSAVNLTWNQQIQKSASHSVLFQNSYSKYNYEGVC